MGDELEGALLELTRGAADGREAWRTQACGRCSRADGDPAGAGPDVVTRRRIGRPREPPPTISALGDRPLQTRVLGQRRRHLAIGHLRGARTRPDCGSARLPLHGVLRKRHITDIECDPAMPRGTACRGASHRAGQSRCKTARSRDQTASCEKTTSMSACSIVSATPRT